MVEQTYNYQQPQSCIADNTVPLPKRPFQQAKHAGDNIYAKKAPATILFISDILNSANSQNDA